MDMVINDIRRQPGEAIGTGTCAIRPEIGPPGEKRGHNRSERWVVIEVASPVDLALNQPLDGKTGFVGVRLRVQPSWIGCVSMRPARKIYNSNMRVADEEIASDGGQFIFQELSAGREWSLIGRHFFG